MKQILFAAGIVALVGTMTAASAHAQAPAPPSPQAASARQAAAPPTPACGPNLPGRNVVKDSRCFELRTYTVKEGGGNIDLLHARFRDHTNRLFKKHGMTIVGFWQPVAKPDQLIYILAYKDAAARDASWAAFAADPEWVKVRTEMAVTLQVDNVFMTATDYSPLK